MTITLLCIYQTMLYPLGFQFIYNIYWLSPVLKHGNSEILLSKILDFPPTPISSIPVTDVGIHKNSSWHMNHPIDHHCYLHNTMNHDTEWSVITTDSSLFTALKRWYVTTMNIECITIKSIVRFTIAPKFKDHHFTTLTIQINIIIISLLTTLQHRSFP